MISMGELAIIVIVAFLLFGPETCITYARRMGRIVGQLKATLSKGEKELSEMMDETKDESH